MKKLRKRLRPGDRDSAFTMVELLVTMLLLTIALVGLAALQLYSVRQVTASRRANEATRLGQSVIERYMTMPYGSLPAPATPPDWDHVLQKDGSSTMVDVGVDGLPPGPYTVEQLTEVVATDVMLVTVRVRWKDAPLGAKPDPNARTLEVMMSTQRTGP